ncbi:type VI secretion system lipoprotein TssJ [Acidocella sp.]|uniref:type VI secretion system lipoprotein TssJ n=1 Tax=Acidocella sp. TaxID=50710 RepID=UPI00261B5E8D|nr:type VI secretion system lipoprotein TssJ [Acidocella sp.]
MKKYAILTMFLVLAGCASVPPPPPVLTLNIIGSAGQNPNPSGLGTAVAVRVYQLAAVGKFQSADVYTLTGNERAALGAEELGSSVQYIVSPDQKLTETTNLTPGTTNVGVAVLFRDINHATWKLLSPVAAHGPTVLTLRISRLTATLGG